MLSDVMNYYSFIRDFKGAGYFETEHHQQIVKELKVAIKQGQMVALSGIVGCGKTTTLKAIQQELNKEKEVVGFYISGHPLDQFKNATRALNIRTLDQLENFEKQEITVAGIVTSKVIKQGQRGSFTIVTIEDTRTSVEIPLFNQDHENFADSLEENNLVLIKGKVQKSYRGDKFEIKISSPWV